MIKVFYVYCHMQQLYEKGYVNIQISMFLIIDGNDSDPLQNKRRLELGYVVPFLVHKIINFCLSFCLPSYKYHHLTTIVFLFILQFILFCFSEFFSWVFTRCNGSRASGNSGESML